jgi:plastocyanin
MQRREFFQKAGIASAVVASTATLSGGSRTLRRWGPKQEGQHGDHEGAPDGPLASASVIFGSWRIEPPLNRFPNSSPPAGNHHPLIPQEVKIKAGGAVSFIISGFHQVVVYSPDARPEDISVATVVNGAGSPPSPPLVDDPVNRVYRGLDPGLQSRDRVEVVQFANPGRYLVICGVLPHFVNGMFGYVNVLP